MKLIILSILMCIMSCSSSQEYKNTKVTPVVEKKEDLEKYIGKLITIKGVVSNTKIPTIIGVDIDSDSPDLRGKIAKATGVLMKWVVKEEEVNKYSANRGAGTFYRLKDPNSDGNSQVEKYP